MMKSRGPRTEPCGTPHEEVWKEERLSSHLTRKERDDKSVSMMSMTSVTPNHPQFSFLPRRAMLVRYMLSSCVRLSVCLVCPSVTRRHCTKMAKRRITQTTLYDSAGILVL